MLASTTPSASFSISSFGDLRGVLGRAVRPVREDSRMPNGAIRAMKESIRAGLADLDKLMSARDQHRCLSHRAYSSTIQLLVLISSTFPPN